MLRVHLTGTLTMSSGDTLLTESGLGRKQSRLALAYLLLNRTRAVSREELAAVVWPADLPDAWDVALRSLLSKLRSAVERLTLAVHTNAGLIRLEFPSDVWIDLETAASALEEAEAQVHGGRSRDAFSAASVAAIIFRRPLLPDIDSPWLDARRNECARKLRRSLVCLATIWLAVEQPVFAIESATEALTLDPTAEDACRLLIRAQLATGNPAAALRTYQTLRTTLRDELGANPSAETEALFGQLLAAT